MEQPILIAAGGTAGHVAPALVVADELRRRGVEVIFAGTPDRMEARIVPARGYRLETFRVSGFERRLSMRLVRALGQAAVAPAACIRIIRRLRPAAVLGGGGFVAGPMIAAAATCRVPTALIEIDAHVGLANRLAAPLADRVLLSFAIPGYEEPRYQVVGRAVEPAFFSTSREAGRALYGIDADDQVVAVFGGSLGAGLFNRVVPEAFAGDRSDGPLVLHVTGRGRAGGLEPGPRYRVFEYCDTMPELLAAADVVVCRAGGSLFEVAAVARPAVVVPWPDAAGGHQAGNAAVFAAQGAAIVVDEDAFDVQRLRTEVARLLGSAPEREALSRAISGLARPGAAAAIADTVLELAGRP
jgi:UDP-N-acetylglucosamine--N-acetylmuramyl-(pentapeptide) pyrophosphoryl-undecaprenol N-acetylglucosamine transferase